MAAPYPIRLKIIAVDGEHPACLEFLGGDDQGCIREIHQPVRIGLHQFERAQPAPGLRYLSRDSANRPVVRLTSQSPPASHIAILRT